MIQHRSIFLSQQMFDVFFMLSVVGATMNSLIFSFAIQHVIFFNGTDPGSIPFNNVQHVQRQKAHCSLRSRCGKRKHVIN